MFEQAVLCCALKDKKSFELVTASLKEGDFLNSKNQELFVAMQRYVVARNDYDFTELSGYVARRGVDTDYLYEVLETSCSQNNLDSYIGNLKDGRLFLSICQFLDNARQQIKDMDCAGDALNYIQSHTNDLMKMAHTRKLELFSDYLDTFFENFDKVKRGEFMYIPTGFPLIDEKITGFYKGGLTIIAAPTGVGKTTFALNAIENIVFKQNKRVGFFSLEMTGHDLVQRVISSQLGIPAYKFAKGTLNAHETQMIMQWSNERMATLNDNFIIFDEPRVTVESIRAQLLRLSIDNKLDILVVDYLQLLKTEQNYHSRYEVVTEISRQLKCLAMDFDIPVVAISQLNRDASKDGGEIKIQHLRDSGSLEQDADLIILIQRQLMGATADSALFKIAKNRRGETGEARMSFSGGISKFGVGESRRFDHAML